MGQNEVLNFLKKNKGMWFSAKQISELIDCNIQTVWKALTKLERDNDVFVKLVMGKTAHGTKMYSYNEQDTHFEIGLKKIELLQKDKRFVHTPPHVLREQVMIGQLVELLEVVKDGKK